jgi:glycosyltransferase involved in cell wall biosynthesis
MRILYVHQYFQIPERGGATRSYEFARRLVARGHDVHIVSSNHEGEDGSAREEVVDGIRVTWLPAEYRNAFGPSRRLLSFLAFALGSSRFAARNGADVVVATSTPLTVALPMIVHRLRHRSATLFEVRDLWPEVPIALGYLQRRPARAAAFALADLAYAFADAVVALSPVMADGVEARGVPPVDVTMVPNGSDLPPSADHAPARRRQVFYGGSINFANDPAYLGALCCELAPKDIEVVIAGRGAGLDIVTDAIRSCPAGSVRMLGYVPKERVYEELRASSLALVLFLQEAMLESNSPNKAFDALGCGTPIGMNIGGWLSDDAVARGCALRLSPDPAIAASQICELVDDPERVAVMSARAVELASEQFDRDVLFDRWETALSRALASRRSRLAVPLTRMVRMYRARRAARQGLRH